jgi:hypothetical protein
MTYTFRTKGENIRQETLYRGTTEVAEVSYFDDPGQGGVIAEVSIFSQGLTRLLSEEICFYMKKRGKNKVQYWDLSQEQIDEEIIKDFGPEFSLDV